MEGERSWGGTGEGVRVGREGVRWVSGGKRGEKSDSCCSRLETVHLYRIVSLWCLSFGNLKDSYA
ncbi:MAG: hypothetical protein ACKESB_01705 [Candidatus Hodgkinia cicadicola]